MALRYRLLLAALAAPQLVPFACSDEADPARRYPCDGVVGWDPGAPLYLEWFRGEFEAGPTVSADSPDLRRGIRLLGEDGEEIPLLFANTGARTVLVCPDGGLAPGTAYTWEVGPFVSASANHIPTPEHGRGGTWRFTTATDHASVPITSQAECLAFGDAHVQRLRCADEPCDGSYWHDEGCDTGAPE